MWHSWNQAKQRDYQPLNQMDAMLGIKLVILAGNHSGGAMEAAGLDILRQCEQHHIPVMTLSESTQELRKQMFFAELQHPNGPKSNYLKWISQHQLSHVGINLPLEQDDFMSGARNTGTFAASEKVRIDHMSKEIIAQLKQVPNQSGVVILPLGAIHADRLARKLTDHMPVSLKDAVEIIVAYCRVGYMDALIMKNEIKNHAREVGDQIAITNRFIYPSQITKFANEVIRPGPFTDEDADESVCGRLAKKCVIL